MALKRKRPTDQLENDDSLTSEQLSDSSGQDLAAFASYSASSNGKQDWDLDAFAPYKPADSRTADNGTASSDEIKDTPIVDLDAPLAKDQNRTLMNFEPTSDFGLLEEAGFASGLSGLHAAPVADPETAERLAAREKKKPAKQITPKDAELLDSSDATDWSKYAAPIPPPLEPSFDDTIDEPVVLAAAKPVAAPQPSELIDEPYANEPGRFFVRLGKFSATYDLDTDSMVVGRLDPDGHSQPEITIEWDDAISRRHARVFRNGDDDYIEDLGSTNGTKVNGIALYPNRPQVLANGDLIHIGSRTEIGYYK